LPELPIASIAGKYKILYDRQMRRKPVEFRGSARDDLCAFPADARREAGYQIDLVQAGGEPDDWKPLSRVGRGAYEIRIRVSDGAFRVVYVAKFEAAIYVLHCFAKKTQETRDEDIDVAKRRYKDLLKELQL